MKLILIDRDYERVGEKTMLFDLASDPVRGGFTVDDGLLRTLDAPGLGVEIDPGA